MEEFRKRRDLALKIMVRFLVKMKVPPAGVTFVGLAAILAFFYFLPTHLNYAVCFLTLYILADCLDGPLARHLQKNSARGAFLDTMVDNVGGIIFVLALINVEAIGSVIGALFLVLVLVSFIFMDWWEKLGKQEFYVFKPRLVLMAIFYLYFFTGINFLREATLFFDGYLLVVNFLLILKIYRKL